MRLLIYNWVQFDVRGEGGGVSVYLRQIIPELINHGCSVTFLSAGRAYDGIDRTCRYRPTRNAFENLGVRSFEIVNSPIKAPAHDAVAITSEALDNQAIASAFVKTMQETGPYDAIVIHNIEGISTNIFEKIKYEIDTQIILFLHNYHLVCPQIELLRDSKDHCIDYHDGRDCIGCFGKIADTRKLMKARMVLGVIERTRLDGTVPGHALRSTAAHAYGWSRDMLALWRNGKAKQGSDNPPAWRRSVAAADDRLEGLAAWPATFKRWREENATRANHRTASIVTVSERAKKQLVERGLRADHVDVAHLGFDFHVPTTTRKERFLARRRVEGPLRLGFFGYDIPSKGLEFLLRTLEDVGSWGLEIELLIFARHNDQLQRRLTRLTGKLAAIHWANGYLKEELDDILQNVDLGIIPSIWYETYSITAYELTMAGVPVLMSDSVGFAELIGDQRFQFKRGDSVSLLSRLEAIVKDRTLLEAYWDDQDRVPSLQQHMDRLMRLIEGSVSERRSRGSISNSARAIPTIQRD